MISSCWSYLFRVICIVYILYNSICVGHDYYSKNCTRFEDIHTIQWLIRPTLLNRLFAKREIFWLEKRVQNNVHVIRLVMCKNMYSALPILVSNKHFVNFWQHKNISIFLKPDMLYWKCKVRYASRSHWVLEIPEVIFAQNK